MEHLALEILDNDNVENGQFVTLPDDTSITITKTSEIFASGDVWTFAFTLNIAANTHVFGTAGDMHGSRLHEQLEKRRARLWVEGVPLYLGYLKLGDEAEVDKDGNIDITFESGKKTFDQLIEGAKANQVPMMEPVLIGMALWQKRWAGARVRMIASPVFDEVPGDRTIQNMDADVTTDMEPYMEDDRDIQFVADGETDGESVQDYPRMVFPKLPEGIFENVEVEGEPTGLALTSVDCLNTDYAYDDAHPYCNTALCYQKYDYKKTDANGIVTWDYSAEPEAQREYEQMPANRVNSAPNFYVIYWLKALFKHIGIHIDENQMMDVEDLKRLFFVNTRCDYYKPKNLRNGVPDTRYGKYRFVREMNETKRLVPEYFGEEHIENVHGVEMPFYDRDLIINKEECRFTGDNIVPGEPSYDSTILRPSDIPTITGVTIQVKGVMEWDENIYNNRETYETLNRFLHEAYATSDCFPDADIADVIKALENGFGIRFLFEDGYQRVRIVLLRNLFRDSDIQDIDCDIVEESRVENCIRGFRMTYGDSEDTTFYYKGFADLLPHKKELWIDTSDKHDYSHWKLDALYKDLIKQVSAFDKTCYVTPKTGNAYGIKIDKDAKRYYDLHPSLFEFAGYMDAEDGDCTGEEETIEMGFTPAIVNDLNMENERSKNSDTHTEPQKFAIFVDEKMRTRRTDLNDGQDYNASDADYKVHGKGGLYDEDRELLNGQRSGGLVQPGLFAINSDMACSKANLHAQLYVRIQVPNYQSAHGWTVIKWPDAKFDARGYINEGYRLYLQDNFEPNDDGVCPIETHDWGLTLGIMRGSGSDASVEYSSDPDDNEGNDTWERVAGSSVTTHPDTCDSYGREWDYNGEASGLGPDDRISLKLRAEKLNPDFNPKEPESDDNPRYLEIEEPSLRQRGLCDKFYKEYSYWVRNARICNRTVYMGMAQLLTLDLTKKVHVGDITGFVRKMQFVVDIKTGLGLVNFEIMYI